MEQGEFIKIGGEIIAVVLYPKKYIANPIKMGEAISLSVDEILMVQANNVYKATK